MTVYDTLNQIMRLSLERAKIDLHVLYMIHYSKKKGAGNDIILGWLNLHEASFIESWPFSNSRSSEFLTLILSLICFPILW